MIKIFIKKNECFETAIDFSKKLQIFFLKYVYAGDRTRDILVHSVFYKKK